MARPVDLDRERRVRSNLAELRTLTMAPAVAGRTLALRDLALSLSTLEDPMGNDKATSVRLPEEVLERLDALAARLAEDPTIRALAGGTLSRSAVLRIAVTRGLEVLEAEHPPSDR